MSRKSIVWIIFWRSQWDLRHGLGGSNFACRTCRTCLRTCWFYFIHRFYHWEERSNNMRRNLRRKLVWPTKQTFAFKECLLDVGYSSSENKLNRVQKEQKKDWTFFWSWYARPYSGDRLNIVMGREMIKKNSSCSMYKVAHEHSKPTLMPALHNVSSKRTEVLLCQHCIPIYMNLYILYIFHFFLYCTKTNWPAGC